MTHTRFAHAIRQFGEHEWDSVAGSELMMSHRWHRVMEASRPDFRPCYALIDDARGPLAAVASAGRSRLIAPGTWRERIAAMLTLTIGAPFSARASGISIRSDVSLAAAMPAIEPALAKLCLFERRPLLGVTNVQEADLRAFGARGFKTVARPPTMVLDLTSASYAEYLLQLPKDDRAEVRRARRRATEHNLELSWAPVTGTSVALFPLFQELCAHHGTSPPVRAEFFAAIAREMPSESQIVVGSVDGQPAGFVACLIQKDALIAPMIGLHYELSRPSCLYQVLIDEMVRWSLERGFRSIHLGLTNERQKRRHGFLPQARYACVRTPLLLRLPIRKHYTCTSLASVDTTTPPRPS